MRLLAQLVRALAWALVAATVVQIYAAGAFVFGAGPIEWHRMVGAMLLLGSLVTALLALVPRETRPNAKHVFAVFGLVVVQFLLVIIRAKLPAVSALHAVNAFAVLVVAFRTASRMRAPAAIGSPSAARIAA
jgi:hypothetical protein